MGQKKDIKLVKRLLKSESVRSKYTTEELLYMEKWLKMAKLEQKIIKAQAKLKGFGK